MKNTSNPFLSLPFLMYALMTGLHLLLLGLMEEGHWLQSWSKAALMPLLIWAVWEHLGWQLSGGRMYAALLCSWLGDLFLLSSEEWLFLLGLSSFLLAHLFYIWIFSHSGFRMIPRASRWVPLVALLPGALMLWLLWNDLGHMRIPVIAYALVISVMMAAAISRYWAVKGAGFWLVLAGAALFMLSDGLIAMGRFSHSFALQRMNIWVMLTYCLAQGLIIGGLIREEEPVRANVA